MCDYSLHHVEARPAIVGDRLVVMAFQGTLTYGFSPENNCNMAVCLKPGTEISLMIDDGGYYDDEGRPLPLPDRVARFSMIDLDNAFTHHDALEFPNGQIVLVTRLLLGQHATVLQLPAVLEHARVEVPAVRAGQRVAA